MKKILFSMMAMAIASFTFTSCEDVPEPYNNPYSQIKPSEPEVVIEPTGSGTAADPWNVAAVIKACEGLADTEFLNNSEDVYVKGIVTETTEVSSQYGNATYYISDDAKASNRFYVYRGKLLDGAAVASDADLQVGDEVTVCGKVKNYKGTMEFDQGNYLVAYKKGEGGGGETPAAPGTQEKPLTVAEALTYINALGADKQSPVGFVKGKICTIGEVDTGQYGNATYSISDDGTENGTTLQIYRGYSFGGEKFKSANEIKVGDEVIVTGKLVNFKGNTPQFAQGSSIYSLNGKVAGGGSSEGVAKGDGTLANPFNPVAAINFTSQLASGAKSANDVYIKGKISKIANNGTFAGGGTYGNASFYISEDGTESNEFYVFRTLYLGNVKYTSGTDIKIGDEVIICGKVMNYMGNTPETSANESYIYSLNGQTAGGGETPPTPPTGEVKKVTIAEFNAAAESTEVWYQLTGKVKNLKEGDLYGNFDLEDATGSVYVYGLLATKGGEKKKFQDLVAAKGIKEGCTLTLIGNRGSYNDKIEVMNAYFVSIEGGDTPGGGTTPGGETPSGNGGVLEGNKLTVVYGDLGITSVDSPIKLVDGTTLTFSQEDGKNKPVYHESTKIVRMYAHNSVTINAGSKVIDSVVFNYDTYNGTPYCGNEELYGEAGGKKLNYAKDAATLSFSSVGASSLKVVNDLASGNSGGVQFRCTGLVINFK